MKDVSAPQNQSAPLVIGIYGAGPTGTGSSNADVKVIADAAGGTMFNGPGNMPKDVLWQMPIFRAIDARYLKSVTGTPPRQKLILFGYSMGGRGAVVIATMLALQPKYRHIDVALAGIDPVQLVDEDPIALPDNVVAWVNYYQRDESGQGIVDWRWGWPPVNIDMGRISGGPFQPGARTGPGENYKLTTKSEGRRVNHITIPALVKERVLGFIRTHQQTTGPQGTVMSAVRGSAAVVTRGSTAQGSRSPNPAPGGRRRRPAPQPRSMK